MRTPKFWLFSTLALALLAGLATLADPSPSRAEPQRGEERRENQRGEERRENQSYWQHHDGKFNYYHAPDQRWYHTDGSNWYAHNGNAWEPYRFDRDFGRQGFQRGGYQVPANVVVPRHGIYRPR